MIARTYTWDENGWGERTNCDPIVDTDCYYAQYRTWEVLSKVGKEFTLKKLCIFVVKQR